MTRLLRPSLDPASVPALRLITEASRAELLQNSVVHTVAPGTLLFDEGETPNFQHAVLSGSVHLLGRSAAGREVLIESVEAPDLVIPAAVLTASPYLMRGRAPEWTRLLLIHAEVFRSVALRDPILAREVIGSLAGQFRRMVRQVKSLKLRSTTERVGCYLIALSKRQHSPGRAVLPYEKTLVASELGMTRESFSRALSALRKEGIAARGNVIAINDPERLADLCGWDPLIDEQGEALQTAGAQHALAG